MWRKARPRIKASKGMGCAPSIGNRRTGAQADARELIDQDRERRRLSSMQMISACGIDDDPVRRIGSDDRGEALQHPEREPLQRLAVRFRIGVLDHQALNQRLGLACGHAGAEASGLGRHVSRQDDAPSSVPAHQDQRRLRRRRAGTPKGNDGVARRCWPSICRTWARRDSMADDSRTG
jgi:hypothetical protein